MKKLSCIIINYNTSEMTHKVVNVFCEAAEKIDFEVIVVDNGSSEIIKDFTDTRITLIKNQENLGFAGGVNLGLSKISGEYVLLLNSDVFINQEALLTLINYLENHPEVGIVGPMMKFPKGDFQASVGFLPTAWKEFLRFSTLGKYIPGGTLLYKNYWTDKNFFKPILVDWVSGGCLLTRKKIIETVGGLDEGYFLGIEDFDFCLRVQKNNFSIVYLPITSVIHHHGYSSGGHASVYSLEQEKKGMNYFLLSNFKDKVWLRFFVMFLYNSKILLLSKILGRS